MEIDKITPEMTKELILTNHNTYFTLKNLKTDFLKIIRPNKSLTYEEEKELRNIGMKIGHSLKPLIKEGFIERYNNHTFKIIKPLKK